MTVYGIGDVHGRADLLEALLDHIRSERSHSTSENVSVFFLGDIIDRGPDSRTAMEMVVDTLKQHPSSRLILGNHEEFLLLFIDRPDKRDIVFDHWMRSGGLACAVSYGLNPAKNFGSIENAQEELLSLLLSNPDHVGAMRRAERMVKEGGHVFVHAGVRPNVRLPDQSDKDLRTIRDGFLDSESDFGYKVVHGHTVTASRMIEVLPNRIALDTGAAETGLLSCIVLEEDGSSRFLQTSGQGRNVRVRNVKPLRLDGTLTRAA